MYLIYRRLCVALGPSSAGRLLGERYAQVETCLGPVAHLVPGLLAVLWMIRVVKQKLLGAATGEGPEA